LPKYGTLLRSGVKSKPRTLGQSGWRIAADVERALAELPQEAGVTYAVRGPVQAMRSGMPLLGLRIVVAAVLVYLVMMAQIRLRPILMTTLALVASMLPLSIQFAPGGEAMIPLARAFIGGVLVSTLLTLFLVPCVYTLVKRSVPGKPASAPS
jgi:multidrug efflux pump subunit AcrB